MKITRLEVYPVRSRWTSLIIYTDAGLAGLGGPVYELLGGPTRRRVGVYSHARTPDQIRADKRRGFTAFKTSVPKQRPFRYAETPKQIAYAAKDFVALRAAAATPATRRKPTMPTTAPSSTGSGR